MADGSDGPAGLKQFLRLYHSVAEGLDGIFVLTVINPRTNKVTPLRFEIGDIVGMAAAVIENRRHSNVYFAPALYRRDLPTGCRGTAEDIVALLGFAIDDDADTGKRALLPPDLVPSVVITTSMEPTVNRHLHFVFTRRPVPLEDARPLAELLHRKCGGDYGTKDINHAWRLPGTLNHPTPAKIERGRPAEPQPVEVTGGTFELWEPADLKRVLEAMSDAQPERGRNSDRDRETDRDELMDRLPDWLRAKIAQETNGADRSTHTYSVMQELMRQGLTDEEVRLVADGAPFAGKFSERGDLDAEIARARKKWQEAGCPSVKRDPRRGDIDRAHKDQFRRDKSGRMILSRDPQNIRTALNALGIKLRYDAFADRMLITGLSGFGPVLDDAAMARLWITIKERFGFMPAKDFFWTVVADTARRDCSHPVVEYLDGLPPWDGTPRLDRWLSIYGEADDTPYTRAVGALPLIAAVRRVRKPGCKFDEMLVLEGRQGCDKSSAFAVLAGPDEWFSDDLPLGADTARLIEATAGRWIVEASELARMRRTDVEHLKAQLSRQVDRARLAWARTVSQRRRQFVIVGTTNDSGYLRDGTGNRRFWPVRVNGFDLDALRRDRDQLWAEAVAREKAGESIRLASELWPAAHDEQQNRRIFDPWLELLADALAPVDEEGGKLPVSEAWRIVGVPPERRTQEHNRRLGEAMRELGWRRELRRFGEGKREYAYVNGDGERLIVVREDEEGLMSAQYFDEPRGRVVASLRR